MTLIAWIAVVLTGQKRPWLQFIYHTSPQLNATATWSVGVSMPACKVWAVARSQLRGRVMPPPTVRYLDVFDDLLLVHWIIARSPPPKRATDRCSTPSWACQVSAVPPCCRPLTARRYCISWPQFIPTSPRCIRIALKRQALQLPVAAGQHVHLLPHLHFESSNLPFYYVFQKMSVRIWNRTEHMLSWHQNGRLLTVTYPDICTEDHAVIPWMNQKGRRLVTLQPVDPWRASTTTSAVRIGGVERRIGDEFVQVVTQPGWMHGRDHDREFMHCRLGRDRLTPPVNGHT